MSSIAVDGTQVQRGCGSQVTTSGDGVALLFFESGDGAALPILESGDGAASALQWFLTQLRSSPRSDADAITVRSSTDLK